jgi:hypothetical protein
MSFDSVELYGILLYIIITTLDNARNTPYKLLQQSPAKTQRPNGPLRNGPFPTRSELLTQTRSPSTTEGRHSDDQAHYG